MSQRDDAIALTLAYGLSDRAYSDSSTLGAVEGAVRLAGIRGDRRATLAIAVDILRGLVGRDFAQVGALGPSGEFTPSDDPEAWLDQALPRFDRAAAGDDWDTYLWFRLTDAGEKEGERVDATARLNRLFEANGIG